MPTGDVHVGRPARAGNSENGDEREEASDEALTLGLSHRNQHWLRILPFWATSSMAVEQKAPDVTNLPAAASLDVVCPRQKGSRCSLLRLFFVRQQHSTPCSSFPQRTLFVRQPPKPLLMSRRESSSLRATGPMELQEHRIQDHFHQSLSERFVEMMSVQY